jgi:uncharacterized protein
LAVAVIPPLPLAVVRAPPTCNRAANRKGTPTKSAVVGAALAALLWILVQPVMAQSSLDQTAETAPSARKLELVRQLVEATSMNTIMTGVFHDMMVSLSASLKTTASPEAQARRKIFQAAEADALAKMVPKIVESRVNGYARTFTEQELSDMLAFYQSPSGRSMAAKTPQLTQAMVGDLAGLAPQMRRDMGEEACAKLTCTTAERAFYFGPAPAKN